MELRSGRAAPSVASTPPQRDAECSAPAESASPPPPILSPQVTASEAMVMLDVPDDVVADTANYWRLLTLWLAYGLRPLSNRHVAASITAAAQLSLLPTTRP